MKIGFLNRVTSVISGVLRETTLTISVSTGECVSMESEIVREDSLSTKRIIRDNTTKDPILISNSFCFF